MAPPQRQEASRWFWKVPGSRGWIPLPPPGMGRNHDFPLFMKVMREHRQSSLLLLLTREDRLRRLVSLSLWKQETAMKHALIQQAVSEIDLSKELDIVGRLDRALTKMHRELCAMLFVMPSCISYCYDRNGVSIEEIFCLQKELNQHFSPARLQYASSVRDRHYSVGLHQIDFACQPLQHVPCCIAEVCSFSFVGSILSALVKGIAVRVVIVLLNLGAFEKPGEESLFVSMEDRLSVMNYDVDAAVEEGDRSRKASLQRAELEPPQVLRLIDCRTSCKERQVVLVDWKKSKSEGFSAISHTYGEAVYEVFNCSCASRCEASKARARCAPSCPHDPNIASDAAHYGVLKDILNMCETLRAAEVDYAWHDGVCIAQHDEDEVRETIQHIGWIYASARETIVFLHYVGKPMAPVRPSIQEEEMTCRWHTRVWTIQEAALSKRRRYCIRMNMSSMRCRNAQETLRMVGLFYDEESSRVEVVSEGTFLMLLYYLNLGLSMSLFENLDGHPDYDAQEARKMIICWLRCVQRLLGTLQFVCFGFPTIDHALQLCARRESKHRGDRVNSILTLAGVKGFVADKDINVEASTLEFFRRQGQVGLARALFCLNILDLREHPAESRKHKWLPVLDRSFANKFSYGCKKGMRFRVLEDGRLEVKSKKGYKLECIRVRIVHKPADQPPVSEPGAYFDLEIEEREMARAHLSQLNKSCDDHKLEMYLTIDGVELALLHYGSSYRLLGTLATGLVTQRRPTLKKTARLISPSEM